MRRYGRLLAVQLRASLLLAMQYRVEFLLDGFVEVFWMVPAIVPLAVIFHARPSLGGAHGETWTFGEALMVVGWFTFLQGVLEAVINPSLVTVVEHIRKGTLDFVLLKPADAQFLVSTARFQPWQSVNVLTAVGIFAWGFHRLGRWPTMVDVGAATVAMVAAVVVLYSLWILTVSTAFYVVRIDNLSHLFNAVFDAARWPVGVFPRVVRLLFTFVVPLALMTTFPAKALLGSLGTAPLAGALAGAALAFAVARGVWSAAIARYTSAGG
jgi:ABC-2 type transport system permease protein